MLFYTERISLSEILDEQLLQPFDCWWMELLGNVSERQHANRPEGQSLLRSSPLRSSAGEGAGDARCWAQRDFSPLHAHFAPGWMADARQKSRSISFDRIPRVYSHMQILLGWGFILNNCPINLNG